MITFALYLHFSLNSQLDLKKLAQDEAVKSIARVISGGVAFRVDPKASIENLIPTRIANFRPVDYTRHLLLSMARSKDGRVKMFPGDYAVDVDTYCMHAGVPSPFGHKYEMAPVSGKLGIALTLHKYRAALMGIPKNEIQMVSWALQAGTTYDKLSDAQRSHVDAVLPEFVNGMKADLFADVDSKYNSVRGIVGLPSLDSVINQMGDVGKLLLDARHLRTNLSDPSLSAASLIERLIPTGIQSALQGGTKITPWSKIGNGQYARILTNSGAMQPALLQLRIEGDPKTAKDVAIGQFVANSQGSGAQTMSFGPQNHDGRAICPSEFSEKLGTGEQGARNAELFEAVSGIVQDLAVERERYLDAAKKGDRDLVDIFPLVYHNVTDMELRRIAAGPAATGNDGLMIEAKLTEMLYFYKFYRQNRNAYDRGLANNLSPKEAAKAVEPHWQPYYEYAGTTDAASDSTAWFLQMKSAMDYGMKAHINGDLDRSIALAYNDLPKGTSWDALYNDFMKTEETLKLAYGESMSDLMSNIDLPRLGGFWEWSGSLAGELLKDSALELRKDAFNRAKSKTQELAGNSSKVSGEELDKLKRLGAEACAKSRQMPSPYVER